MKTTKILLMVLLFPFMGFAKSKKQDLTCLTQAIYFEARGDSLEGRAAVANVVMNRLNKWNYKSVCDVTAAKGQFGWWETRNRKILEKNKWEEANIIAKLVYSGLVEDNTGGATFFHERSIKPYWTKRMVKVGVIGRHTFYIS